MTNQALIAMMTNATINRWLRCYRYRPVQRKYGTATAVGILMLTFLVFTLILGIYTQSLEWRISALTAEMDAMSEKLHDTETMLITCLNGGTAAMTQEQKNTIYIECPSKAKERILL